jgi:tetratricopeptide (TPR) repeat protein
MTSRNDVPIFQELQSSYTRRWLMKRQNMFVIVMMMALLSACIAPPASSVQTTSAQAVSEESAHDHVMDPAGEIGTVNFPVSCTPEAQAEFNHAVAMLHSFWFGPAIKSFNTVAELDPTCAMAHWGVAMSLFGNPFSWPLTGQPLIDGWAAVEKATAAGAKTPREAAYIAAVTAFYQDAETVEHSTRAIAYAAAMEKLTQEFPDDTEAAIFYALALDVTALPTDKTYANQMKAVEILGPIFVEQPNHPGVAHYLIHSNDYPALAAHGLDAALSYAEIAPAAPHALHMPSHIYTRLGYWQESIDTNLISAEIAQDDLAAKELGVASSSMLHPMDYLMYAYLQRGQDGAAKALLDETTALTKMDAENATGAYAFAAIPSRYALERGQWAEAAALSLHPQDLAWEKFPQAEAVLVFARGLGAARNGDVAAANQDLERLQALTEAMIAIKQGYFAEQAAIQSQEIAAWIALAEGENEEALAQMRSAVELEAATEKHPVTPGPLVPAHELLGEMLLELDQPAEALAEFEASQVIEPNRFRGLYGAARAAELAGEVEQARAYYEELVALAASADSERPELATAKQFLGQ